MNIQGLRSNFDDCEFFLESNSPDILTLCETNLDDLTDSGNFSVRCYLPSVWKNSGTHMCGLVAYVKEGVHFAQDLSLKNSADSYVFGWLYFTQCLTSFSFIDHLLHLCAQFLILYHQTDKVLSINPSANVFVFWDVKVHHKDWLTYSGGTDLKWPCSDG